MDYLDDPRDEYDLLIGDPITPWCKRLLPHEIPMPPEPAKNYAELFHADTGPKIMRYLDEHPSGCTTLQISTDLSLTRSCVQNVLFRLRNEDEVDYSVKHQNLKQFYTYYPKGSHHGSKEEEE